MTDPTSLLIVDDHQLFRECLCSVLQEDASYRVKSVSRPADALDLLADETPDILLADILLPGDGALDLAHWVSTGFPKVKILILGLEESESEILRCIEAGASGYVLKEASLEDLRESVAMVMRGSAPCSPKIAYRVFSRLAELSDRHWDARLAPSSELSVREVEILELVSKDCSNKEIADRLCLSLHTVKNHMHRILAKLPAKNRRGAVTCARERRLIA